MSVLDFTKLKNDSTPFTHVSVRLLISLFREALANQLALMITLIAVSIVMLHTHTLCKIIPQQLLLLFEAVVFKVSIGPRRHPV